MTLIAAYGLDNYDNLTEFFSLEPEWSDISFSSTDWSTTAGRFGGGMFRPHRIGSGTGENGIKLVFTTAQPKTMFFGASFLIDKTGGTKYFLRFFDGGSEHLRIVYNTTTARVQVLIRTVFAGEFVASTEVWHRLEIKLVIDDAAGEITVRLDDNEVFTDSGIDTQGGANAWTDVIHFTGSNNSNLQVKFDDITVNDDQGSFNNDWLGDLKIETLRPTADGDATDFTPSAGANWENVDDLTGPDEDSTFNESSVAGHQDLYITADLSGSPNVIHAVVIRATIKKDDAGARSINLLTKTGSPGTTDVGATQTLLTDYVSFNEIHEVDPDTGVAWTVSDVDGMQIGVQNV